MIASPTVWNSIRSRLIKAEISTIMYDSLSNRRGAFHTNILHHDYLAFRILWFSLQGLSIGRSRYAKGNAAMMKANDPRLSRKYFEESPTVWKLDVNAPVSTSWSFSWMYSSTYGMGSNAQTYMIAMKKMFAFGGTYIPWRGSMMTICCDWMSDQRLFADP